VHCLLLHCFLCVRVQVDFIAVSFVRTADVITNLRSYIETRTAPAGSLAAGAHIDGADAALHDHEGVISDLVLRTVLSS
jgi:hypothetical protein